MKQLKAITFALRSYTLLVPVLLMVLAGSLPAAGPDPTLDRLLDRTGTGVATFLDRLASVKCTEDVDQWKLAKTGKPEYKEVSTFDYLLLAQPIAGDLTLVESREPQKKSVERGEGKKNVPLLVTNGFATLLLIFHPSYQASFHFSPAGTEMLEGRNYDRVEFQHIKGRRSTAVLVLRQREYPLDLQGTAWIEQDSGQVLKINAQLEDSMEDVGLKSLNTEVQYAPVEFQSIKQAYWLPERATVDVETPRQHWRNVHRFTAYKRFSTSVQSTIGSTP